MDRYMEAMKKMQALKLLELKRIFELERDCDERVLLMMLSLLEESIEMAAGYLCNFDHAIDGYGKKHMIGDVAFEMEQKVRGLVRKMTGHDMTPFIVRYRNARLNGTLPRYEEMLEWLDGVKPEEINL